MNLKALKRNLLGPVAVLLMVLLIAVVISGIIFSGRSVGGELEAERFARRMDDWVNIINAEGVDQFIADEVPGEDQLPEDANLVLISKDNKVLYSTSDAFIGGWRDATTLMLSPYITARLDWRNPENTDWSDDIDTRLALLVGNDGEILASMRCVASADVANLGASSPKYSEYFPSLDHGYYQDAVRYTAEVTYYSEYDWSSVGGAPAANARESLGNLQPDILSEYASDFIPQNIYDNTPPNKVMAQKVIDYVQWENAQMSQAGIARMICRGPAWDGTQMLLIYPDSDAMHQSSLQRDRAFQAVRRMEMLTVALIGLFILTLAGWVFVDAKRRDFRPALWGILTLFGNVIAWLVYMLVRPNGRAAKGCPGCGAPIRGHYAYCANCGAQLCEICAQCDRALEPSFHFCPHCGRAVSPPAEAS